MTERDPADLADQTVQADPAVQANSPDLDQQKDNLQQESVQDLEVFPEPGFQLDPADAPAAVEALLFAAGDPLPLEKIRLVTGLERTTLVNILADLSARYERDRNRGVMLREIDGNWLLCTKPAQSAILQRLFQPRHRPPLSQAAYEVLAIIAYNQPVTRAQVEAVRGVNSDSIISRLLERGLVCEEGTMDAPGRPALFATTEQFLLDFGLRSVKDLPPMEMLMYGTLRDFEVSLEEAAGQRHDKQLTIDQLVQTIGPGPGDEFSPPVRAADSAGLPDQEFLQFSEALFGEDPSSRPETPGPERSCSGAAEGGPALPGPDDG
jgi:segregation and condensation protein B